MKQWYKNMMESFHHCRDDLEYLLIVGIPGGILMILLHDHMDFSKVF
jgi:hypothetical protein